MSQPKLFFFWLFIFIISIFLGIGCCFLLFTYLKSGSWEPWNTKLVDTGFGQDAVIDKRAHQYFPENNILKLESVKNPIPTTAANISLVNPFVIPGQYRGDHYTNSPKKDGVLEYKGIIETDNNNVLGLVRVNVTGDSFIVSEGDDLIEEGIIIRKIMPKTLTYSQNGIEKVVSLGRLSN